MHVNSRSNFKSVRRFGSNYFLCDYWVFILVCLITTLEVKSKFSN